MLFDEIVSEACERLNLTSDEAKSRVSRHVNNRYRALTTSIGLQTSRIVSVSQVATINNRLITFTNIEKILAVIDKTDPLQDIVLEQITPDEMHVTPQRLQPPRKFALWTMDPISVTIEVDCTPSQSASSAVIAGGGTGYTIGDVLTLSGGTLFSGKNPTTFKVATLGASNAVATVTLGEVGFYTVLPTNPVSVTGGTGSGCTLTVTWAAPFTLYADALSTVTTLSGSQKPDFPESFHDILIYGAMADEYFKMEKPQMAQMFDQKFEQRLSDLRGFIAKTAYLDQYQGRYNGRAFRWSRDAQLLWDS